MSEMRASNLVDGQLAEEDQQLVSDLHELSRQLRDCIEEIASIRTAPGRTAATQAGHEFYSKDTSTFLG